MARLIISGVCDSRIFKTVLLSISNLGYALKGVEETGDKVEITISDEEEAFHIYRELCDNTHNAEADYELRLTSYDA